ncbi:phage tail assembly chaperone G [Lacticaseibacillus yichunensis]|uniref:Phage tail assembly chaperone G n=2 Tax=Bacilli TaxID=91061 RepID=A0ABW4CNL2_9LACO|nr:hypothetical protein [Lacticaseibacillus yichunensis]
MAYEIELEIDGKLNKFVRNDEPHLRDINNATKLQRNWLQQMSRDDGATNQDIDEEEQLLAKFAVDFFHGQFTKDEVIDGATKDAVNNIYVTVSGILAAGQEEPSGDAEPKKSPRRTSTKPSASLTDSTTLAAKKATH